ncbi:HAD family hydrolase [Candidatus Stoquefichus massiliensis]|uniref:HAD family hydrolase n=1 Tax=Candidatus Stoquefichus massiliensis TaxID=1470350 RepID=UPI0004B775C6|nr:HAD family hydrolase [Candidatus Stoquefichus massiliensis]
MIEGIKALFFDLDDTLICFGGVTHQAWELTCQQLTNEMEISIDALTLAHQINVINDAYWSNEENRPKGNVDFQLVRKGILRKAFDSLDMNNDLAIAFLLDHYAYYKEKAIYLYSDVHETLDYFHSHGYKLVLITNGDGTRQREKILRFDLEKHFDLILIEGEQGIGKPDRRVYQKALDFCDVLANQACMVGDNYLWEVKAPIEYGLKGIWVNHNGEILSQDDIQPTLMIQQISELISFIR